MVAISVWVLTAYRRVEIDRPRSSLSLGRQTVESLQLACETTPPCLISFPLPLYLLHSPSTRWSTRRNGVLSNCHTVTPPVKSRSHTPSFETYSQAASCLGISLRVYCHEANYNGGSASERAYQRRPTPLETQEKTTETETHSSLATVHACTVHSRQILDTNQSN